MLPSPKESTTPTSEMLVPRLTAAHVISEELEMTQAEMGAGAPGTGVPLITPLDFDVLKVLFDVEPYYDPKMESVVVKKSDNWIVSVTPMIFNDRVLLTTEMDYPYGWTAGWCYDKGGAAILAAATVP